MLEGAWLNVINFFSSVDSFGLEESSSSTASVVGGAMGGAEATEASAKPKLNMSPEEVARRVVSILSFTKIY